MPKWMRLVLATCVVVHGLSAQGGKPMEPVGVAVRYPEGTVHGILELRTAAGGMLAGGDLVQQASNGGMTIRMTFRFADSSFFEETTTFTQRRVFALQSYHLVERGAAFARDLDATLSANGQYLVISKSRDAKSPDRHEGHLDLPADVSNGLIITLLKNLPRHDSTTVHLVAFTPTPRLVSLRLAPIGEQRVSNGGHSETAVEYLVKSHVGGLVGVFARVLGKMPEDTHVWIVTNDVPAFLRFEGPLFDGPVWRIDPALLRWR